MTPSAVIDSEDDWMDFTPEALDKYELGMWSNADPQQVLSLTRDEFIALKRHLAAMRRVIEIDVKATIDAIAVGFKDEFCSENEASQQIARRIQFARDIYRANPDVVVTEQNIDDVIEEFAK